MDKQLTELSEFINTNLSQKESEADHHDYYPALISDLKSQVTALEKSQSKAKSSPSLSKASSFTEMSSPVDHKIFSYTKSVINKYSCG